MRRVIFFLMALGACSGPPPAPTTHTVANAECSIDGVATVAGALRNDGTGWYAIADSTHAPLNIASVATKDGMITVEYTFTASKIHTFIAAPDETLARAGYSAGASVGVGSARILLAKNGSANPFDVSTKSHPWSNIWIYGVFEAGC